LAQLKIREFYCQREWHKKDFFQRRFRPALGKSGEIYMEKEGEIK